MAPKGDKRSNKPSGDKPQSSRSKEQPRKQSKEDEFVAGSSSKGKGRDVSSRDRDAPGAQQHTSAGGSSAGSGYDALGARMEDLSLDPSSGMRNLPQTAVLVSRYGPITSVSTRDPATGLTSAWSIGPESKKTIRRPAKGDDDPDGSRERRFKGYDPSADPVRDYSFGRVIEILIVPPPPGDKTGGLGLTSKTEYFVRGTGVQKRRYVIIRGVERNRIEEGFSALPIKTYNGRGVDGQVKWHHCVIYTHRPHPHANPPEINPAEEPQRMRNGQLESPMQTHAILVIPRDRGWALDPMSRLELVDVHEFEAHVDHVRLLGKVERDHRPWLLYQHEAVKAGINVRVGIVTETALPLEQLWTWYNNLRQRALQLRLTPPRNLTQQEVQYLASSHDARIQFQNRVSRDWSNEQQQITDAARRAEQEGSDEGNDNETDDQAHDDEEDDNDYDDDDDNR